MLKPLEVDLTRIASDPTQDALMIGVQIGNLIGRVTSMRQAYEDHGITPRPYVVYVHPSARETVRNALQEAGYIVAERVGGMLDIAIAQPDAI